VDHHSDCFIPWLIRGGNDLGRVKGCYGIDKERAEVMFTNEASRSKWPFLWFLYFAFDDNLQDAVT
jgi:hypothetical protein